MRRTRALCVVLAVSAACVSEHDRAPSGSGGPGAGPTKRDVEHEHALAPTPTSGYEVHEWGLLAFQAGADVVASGSPVVETAGHGGGSGVGNAYEPVLYVQLARDTRSVTFDAEVRAPAHVFPESWPIGAATGDTLRWAHVQATLPPPEGCGAHYPTASDPPCTTSSDGYCEAMNAAAYEASDGACLAFGGAKYDHLLYRATLDAGGLPFDVTRGPDGSVSVTSRPGAPFAQMWRVRRDFTSSRVEAAAFHAPAPGRTAPVPEPVEVQAPRVLAQILSPLLLARLTRPERDAFAHAWHDAIVPEETPTAFDFDRMQRLSPQAQPPADALYYWLPQELADRILPLHFTPEPNAVHRALLVRVSLEAAPLPWNPLQSHADLTSPIDVTGLDAEVVRRVLRRHVNEIMACHRMTGGGLRVLNLSVSLTDAGTTTDVQVDSQPDVPRFDRCVAHRASTWTFPPPSPAEGARFRIGIGMTSGTE